MKCNPLKCDLAVVETDFLRYWMTSTAIKPMKNKIAAVLNMQRPTTKKGSPIVHWHGKLLQVALAANRSHTSPFG